MTDTLLHDTALLARAAASEDRGVREQLTLAVAENCAARDVSRTASGGFVAELLLDLARSAARDIKLRLAEILAESAWAPHDVVVFLANEEIDVARAVIAASPQLFDDDLVAIAHDATLDHRVAIAGRPTVSQSVADALAAKAEAAVLTALTENHGARLSRPTLEICVDAARAHEPIREPLSRRAELDEALALDLCAIAGEAVRAALVARFEIDPEKLKAALSRAVKDSARGAEPNDPDAAAVRLVAKLADAGRLEAGFAVRAAREGRLAIFDHAVARLAGVTPNQIRQAIDIGGMWAGALACRAARIDRGAFQVVHSAFADAGRAPRRLSSDAERAAANVFVSMTPSAAADALRRIAAGD